MSAKPTSGLNVYKKVAIIRKADDVLSFEDADGSVKAITDLHLAAASTTPVNKPKPKNDIPIPKIKDVATYKTDVPANYQAHVAYVRPSKPSHKELKEKLEYVVDAEDEVWLINNSKFGGASKYSTKGAEPKRTADGEQKATIELPLQFLEIMLDVLEKATAFEAIITKDQFETLVLTKLPALYHMYPIKGRAGLVTMKIVLTDVYNYWVSKRSKLKRPLLRRFWPVTSTDDTNPHLVFRPREKEKYKLRKKRQNDMDAFRKMEQLRQDFSHVRAILELVKKREEMNRSLVLLQREWFQQKIHDAVDTSGRPRTSQQIDSKELDSAMVVERYFDVQRGWKQNSTHRGQLSEHSGRLSMPIDALGKGSSSNIGGSSSGGNEAHANHRPLSVAGQNHGEPAPNFLEPLDTRESFHTSWSDTAPHVTSLVDAGAQPTYLFRHRPRMGRGGRMCIDRMPLPTNNDDTTQIYFHAGGRKVNPNSTTVARQPPSGLDKERLSRRIHAISMDALREDYETPPGGLPGQGTENDGEVVLVKMQDWLDTDDQLWGEERFAVGPI